MDKNNSNKGRTDMLAAGRKKLQQYRKKKDGKGSKKGGKSEQDAKTDEVAKAANSADAKLPVSGGEGSGSVNVPDVKPAVSGDEGSGSDYGRELVNAPSLHSTENSVAADGQLTSESFPEVVKIQSDVAEANEVGQCSNVCNEEGGDSSVQNKAGTSSDIDTDTAYKFSEMREMVGSEEKPHHVSVSSPVDFFDASDSINDDGKGGDAIEVKPTQGVDQGQCRRLSMQVWKILIEAGRWNSRETCLLLYQNLMCPAT